MVRNFIDEHCNLVWRRGYRQEIKENQSYSECFQKPLVNELKEMDTGLWWKRRTSYKYIQIAEAQKYGEPVPSHDSSWIKCIPWYCQIIWFPTIVFFILRRLLKIVKYIGNKQSKFDLVQRFSTFQDIWCWWYSFYLPFSTVFWQNHGALSFWHIFMHCGFLMWGTLFYI